MRTGRHQKSKSVFTKRRPLDLTLHRLATNTKCILISKPVTLSTHICLVSLSPLLREARVWTSFPWYIGCLSAASTHCRARHRGAQRNSKWRENHIESACWSQGIINARKVEFDCLFVNTTKEGKGGSVGWLLGQAEHATQREVGFSFFH